MRSHVALHTRRLAFRHVPHNHLQACGTALGGTPLPARLRRCVRPDSTASETAEEPRQADSRIPEIHEDAHPVELAGMALQELDEQGLLETEQPRPRMELSGHEPPKMQANHYYR